MESLGLDSIPCTPCCDMTLAWSSGVFDRCSLPKEMTWRCPAKIFASRDHGPLFSRVVGSVVTAPFGFSIRRSNNTAHHAREKRTMIARRENFGGTTPSHFLWQATAVKNTRRPRQRHITARRTRYAIKPQRFHLPDLFPDKENILLPSRGHIMRVPGAPSPKS